MLTYFVGMRDRTAGASNAASVHGRRRSGFSVLEIVVSVSIVATLAVLIVPSVDALIDKVRMDLIEDTLREYEDAIEKFRAKVGSNPGKLSQLGTPITTADSDPCDPYSSQDVAAWPGTPPAGGPYINQALPNGPFKIGTFGMAQNTLIRDPPTQGGVQRFHFLSYTITGVTRDDAISINERIDGSADLDPASPNNLTGTVQWGNPDSQGFVTVTYRLIIPKNTC
ncbi:MAG: hypothetical protein ACR2L6_11400 [Gemmatimonadaceae bacterium]